MITIVYLLIVLSGTHDGVTSQAIPQTNMQQCQVNKKALDSKFIGNQRASNVEIKVLCISGIK